MTADLFPDAEVIVPDMADLRGADYERWQELRRQGIGGSDAATIAAVSPYTSPYELWLDRTGIEPLPPLTGENLRRADAGSTLEPLVRQWTTEAEPGLTVEPCNAMLRSTRWPHMLANLDGIAHHPDRDGPGVFEAKTAYTVWSVDEWADDRVPDYYALQVQHYLAVTGFKWAVFGAWVHGQLLIRWMDRNDELIAYLADLEADFWQRVQDHDRPPMTGQPAEVAAVKRMTAGVTEGHTVTLDDDAVALLRERQELAAEVAELKRAVKALTEGPMPPGRRCLNAIDDELRVLLDDAEAGVDADGRVLVTAKRTDRAAYTAAATSYRTIRIPKGANL